MKDWMSTVFVKPCPRFPYFILSLSQQLSLCSVLQKSLAADEQCKRILEECLASTSEQQLNSVLEKFSFVSSVEKQFNSTVEV